MRDGLTLEKLRIDERLRTVEEIVARLDERSRTTAEIVRSIDAKIPSFPCIRHGESIRWLTWGFRLMVAAMIGTWIKILVTK
jgi:hypothetical protein